MTLNRTANSTVTGLIYKTGASNTGTTQVMFASATYGNGRVCGIADSSPSDDGTGDRNDVLYSSYRTAVSGAHQKLFINSVLWLAGTTSAAIAPQEEPQAIQRKVSSTVEWIVYPNPAAERITVVGEWNSAVVSVSLRDLTGRELMAKSVFPEANSLPIELDRTQLPQGIYLLNVVQGDNHRVLRVVLN